MKYHFPDYYRQFICIGGQCPDTCCAGWNIEIDNRSLAYYRTLLQKASSGNYPPEFVRQLTQAINFRKGTFRLNGRRCAFLNDANLCDLYIHAGKDSLCQTCRSYPRHLEEFGSVREISLSLSCPEAARIILSQANRPAMLTKITKKSCPKDQEVDSTRLQWLLDARDILLDILWQDIPLELAVSMTLAFSHDLQRRYRKSGYFTVPSRASDDLKKLSRHYLAPGSDQRFLKQCQKHLAAGRFCDHLQLQRSLTALYAPLIPLVPQWPAWMDRCEHTALRLSYTQYPASRQLLTYYLQVYFPGAIYDDDLWGKAVFATLSWLMTDQLARITQDEPDSCRMDPLIRAAYRYSRQVENLDDNLERILQAGSQPDFKLFSLLNLLNKNTRQA